MKGIINSKNLGLVSSALLLGGNAIAQYSPTLALDRLANNGLRFTNFHTCTFRRMTLFLVLFVQICSVGCSDKNKQSPVEESIIDNEEEILVCNDLLNKNNKNVTEIKDIKTKLFFEVRDPLGHPQRFGEGISYIKTDSTALFRYYIYYNNNDVGPIIYTYVCDICNFPDYATEWERQEEGIDIVINGNIYPSFESEKEIHGILELTTLERTKQ
jgi:hypothetical protein